MHAVKCTYHRYLVFLLRKQPLSSKLKICTQPHFFFQNEHTYVNNTSDQKEYITSPLESPISGPFKFKPEIDFP